MNIKKILIFSLFFSFCSPSANEGIVSLSNETTTTLIVAEEDYPIILTQCLNEEKGYNILTPFDVQDLKTTLDQMSNTKDERTQLLEDVDFCVNKYNLFSESNTTNPDELAKLYDENLELAKCLREKGLNVPEPNQQEPKLDLTNLKKSKEDITLLLQECGFSK
ncbi:MAG: hypothetical protein HOI90_04615 [Actinobacteria bacterium]|jgi:hypothetical protein|nr:hypothetical protein [Actinomycetota bacterium]MBT5656080.1 hypothetical protein [Actinomycetota bacterium]